jgi:hypothetical protein
VHEAHGHRDVTAALQEFHRHLRLCAAKPNGQIFPSSQVPVSRKLNTLARPALLSHDEAKICSGMQVDAPGRRSREVTTATLQYANSALATTGSSCRTLIRPGRHSCPQASGQGRVRVAQTTRCCAMRADPAAVSLGGSRAADSCLTVRILDKSFLNLRGFFLFLTGYFQLLFKTRRKF